MREETKNNIEEALDLKLNKKMSYGKIALHMNRPVGTIKRWLAPYKIGVTDESKEILRLAGIKGSLKMQEKYANLRKEAYDSAKKNVEEDLKDKVLRDFVNMYIGEGSKRRKSEFSIVNSDPQVILLSLTIIKRYFLKSNKKIIMSIKYYKDNDNEQELLEYWSKVLNNNPSVSLRTYVQPKEKQSAHNNSNKFGLVRVEVNDTYARQRLNAYIDYLKNEWIREFEKTFSVKFDMNIPEVKSFKTV